MIGFSLTQSVTELSFLGGRNPCGFDIFEEVVLTNMRRYWQPGQIYFTTHVTLNRAPILVDRADLLLDAIHRHKKRTMFEFIAWAILPDHMHLMIDPHNQEMPLLIRRINLSFSTNLRRERGDARGRVWQYRFWDRIMRSQDDINRHVDYIHYNPVKHGLVDDPFLWPHSSLGDFHSRGLYQRDWGVSNRLKFTGEYGE